jgi:hypothetical protein
MRLLSAYEAGLKRYTYLDVAPPQRSGR